MQGMKTAGPRLPQRVSSRMARQRQKGVALVLVLSIVAIVCALASEMLFRQSLMIRLASASVSSGRAWSYMLGGEAWVTHLLTEDWRQSEASETYIDHLGEAWAKPIKDFPIENGKMIIVVEDLQGRLDLNRALTGDDGELTRVRNLLALFNIDQVYVERLLSRHKAKASADKSNEGQVAAPTSSAGDTRAAILLNDTSEFLEVGMSRSDYKKIEPYVVALPEGATGLNVNTASDTVLACLSSHSDTKTGSSQTEGHNANGYSRLSEFLGSASKDAPIYPGGLAVNSEYFRATFYMRWEGYSRTILSTFHRNAKGEVRVIGRELSQPQEMAVQTVSSRAL